MAKIRRTLNKFWIGDIDVFAPMTRDPFAGREVPSASYQALNASEPRCRFEDYLDAGAVSDVDLSPAVNGLILYHADPFSDDAGRDMTLAMVSSSTGLSLRVPAGFKRAHLVSYDNTASHATSFTSSGYLPDQPCFSFSFIRPDNAPAGMDAAAQQWTLTFGGYTLVWSRAAPAAIYTGYGTGSQLLIARRPWSDLKSANYCMATVLRFTVYNLLGNLYIESDAWGGEWIVKRVGNLPAARWTITGAGGKYGWNIGELQFATTGYIETDWIPMPTGVDYPDDTYDVVTAPTGMIGDVYPVAQPSGTATALQVIDSQTVDGAYFKKFRLTLTGDGQHTPVVQAFQYRWDTILGSSADSWLEITDRVLSASESKANDSTAHTCGIELLTREIGGQTLMAALAAASLGSLDGLYAFAYQVGAEYDDDSTREEMRLTGYLDTTALPINVGEVEKFSLTAVDRWARLSRGVLGYPPSCAGMRVDQAIALIAEWVGIVPTEIDADEIDIYLDTVEADGEFTGTLAWTPGTVSAADFIREIADTFGVAVWFDGAGRMQIAERVLPVVADSVATYDAQAGADYEQALTSWEVSQDRSGLVNAVILQGTGADGKPIYAAEYDAASYASEHTPTFMGDPAVMKEDKPDIHTIEQLTLACRKRFIWRPGFPDWRIASHTGDMMFRWPDDVVTFLDRTGTPHYLLTKSVSVEIAPTGNRPSLALEERV